MKNRYFNVTAIGDQGSPVTTQIWADDISVAFAWLQTHVDRALAGNSWDCPVIRAYVFDTQTKHLRTIDVVADANGRMCSLVQV